MSSSHEFVRVFGPKRLDSPTSAGQYNTFQLPGRPGAEDTQTLTYLARIVAASGSDALVRIGVNHSPDGDTTATLDADVVNGTGGTTPAVLIGDVAHTTLVGPFTHPFIEIGSDQGNQEWAVVELWELRKSFVGQRGSYAADKIDGPTRLVGGTGGGNDGYGLSILEDGLGVSRLQLMLKVLEAASGTQVYIDIEHSPNGEEWAVHTSGSPLASVTAPGVVVLDADTAKALGPYYRARVYTSSQTSQDTLVELYRLTNPLT